MGTAYDNTFMDSTGRQGFLAVRWKAHDESNELSTFALLNHAKNYERLPGKALKHYTCPAELYLMPEKDGNIAIIWHNGSILRAGKIRGNFR